MAVVRYGVYYQSIPFVIVGGLAAYACVMWSLGWLANGAHGALQWTLASLIIVSLTCIEMAFALPSVQ